jgi:nucleoside 2-deoxyribosyltransferase
MKIYLAGPDVFLPNSAEVLAAKSTLVREAGLTPLAPGDAQVDRSLSHFDQGCAISEVDEDMMNRADAIIANLTPFRGVSADPGTAFELGYMAARGKAVFAYTNEVRPLTDRIRSALGAEDDGSGQLRDRDGHAVESFAMADNLMLHGGVARRGAALIVHDGGGRIVDLGGFTLALTQAAAWHESQ